MAKDISPPFLLTTHTQSPLLLSDVDKPAISYSNHLLHVIEGGGDRESALRMLADIQQARDSDVVSISSDEDGGCYSTEGMIMCVN